jgi:hypothetical protein
MGATAGKEGVQTRSLMRHFQPVVLGERVNLACTLSTGRRGTLGAGYSSCVTAIISRFKLS